MQKQFWKMKQHSQDTWIVFQLDQNIYNSSCDDNSTSWSISPNCLFSGLRKQWVHDEYLHSGGTNAYTHESMWKRNTLLELWQTQIISWCQFLSVDVREIIWYSLLVHVLFQKRPPKTLILEHWHQNWKEWIDGETDRLVMEAGGRDITPFSDWFSMTPQLYNRPFSCFNFPFSWSLTSLCKSHHHTHLLPQMFEVPAQYF